MRQRMCPHGKTSLDVLDLRASIANKIDGFTAARENVSGALRLLERSLRNWRVEAKKGPMLKKISLTNSGACIADLTGSTFERIRSTA